LRLGAAVLRYSEQFRGPLEEFDALCMLAGRLECLTPRLQAFGLRRSAKGFTRADGLVRKTVGGSEGPCRGIGPGDAAERFAARFIWPDLQSSAIGASSRVVVTKHDVDLAGFPIASGAFLVGAGRFEKSRTFPPQRARGGEASASRLLLPEEGGFLRAR